MNLPQLRQDLANHYLYGTAGAVVGAHVARAFGVDHRIGAVAGAVVIGGIKEAIDRITGKGHASLNDWLATAAGSLPLVLS